MVEVVDLMEDMTAPILSVDCSDEVDERQVCMSYRSTTGKAIHGWSGTFPVLRIDCLG